MTQVGHRSAVRRSCGEVVRRVTSMAMTKIMVINVVRLTDGASRIRASCLPCKGGAIPCAFSVTGVSESRGGIGEPLAKSVAGGRRRLAMRRRVDRPEIGGLL